MQLIEIDPVERTILCMNSGGQINVYFYSIDLDVDSIDVDAFGK